MQLFSAGEYVASPPAAPAQLAPDQPLLLSSIVGESSTHKELPQNGHAALLFSGLFHGNSLCRLFCVDA